MAEFTQVIGARGIMLIIGAMVFVGIYKYSVQLFNWIENQTYGTRDYILQKCELMFIEVKSEHVTYLLLFLSFGQGIILLGLAGLLGSWKLGIVLAVIVSFLGWKIPRPLVDYLLERRIKQYSEQMVDALTLLANGLRAGLSVPQSLAMVVDEMPAPVSQEFNMILQQNKIGVPLEEAFENLKVRVPTEDNEMFVTSVNILRETGGNLAETFDTIVSVIRERVRLKQKIDTYVAQGMFQGGTIFCMPFIMGFMQYMSDPEGFSNAITHPLGIALLIVALILDCIGGYAMLKVVKIKV